MKVVLLGYMASGKSTVGKYLAARLFLPFIDLDDYIEDKEGNSVSDIFNDYGEIYFRRKEHEYLKELLNSDKEFVLSLGGGTPCYAGNMNVVLESKTTSVYLNASIKLLEERLKKNKSKRPLVANLPDDKLTEYIAKHLFERRFFYKQAKHEISIDNKDLDELVAEIRILLH